MSFVDRNPGNLKRLLRNGQRTRNGDATGSIKVSAPVINTAGGIGLSLLSTGGLNLNSSQLQIKLADGTLVTAAGGVKVGTLTSANLPGTVAYTNVVNTFTVAQVFNGNITGPNVMVIEAFAGGTWIDMPTTGPSGIGTGGPGANVWLSYTASAGQYFAGALVGDLNIRNAAGKNINIGIQGSGVPSLIIDHTSIAPGGPVTLFGLSNGLWLDMPTTGPSGLGSGGPGVNAWLAYSASTGQWFTDSTSGDINVRNTTGNINIGTNFNSATMTVGPASVAIIHITGKNAVPGIVAGTGAGTTPTITISGSDLGGKLTVTTGTGPAAASAIVTATFTAAYSSAPNVVFAPGNANAAALSGVTSIFVTSTTTTFVLNAGSTSLTAATQYIWTYHVIG